ncbi:MAG: phosphoenolpyruvate--protein phosphotransferase [Desulfobacterales bacterium S5133MH4]|nr:MAG: phosphoenolpyruvate--protein phosphotransferase [Desulfobacterales bacterium S5133MH4]
MSTEELHNEGMSIVGEIGRIITDSGRPQDTLQKIVELVAGKFDTDVCSIYLFDAGKHNLVLKATVGLSKESIGKIRMSIHEGLTGLVLEEMKPVFVVNPSLHPRYKFFEGSGEEVYRTFIGVPLVYHKDILGVLVVQTLRETGVSEVDINVFSTIASQISATAAYRGLLEDLKKKKDETRDLKKRLSKAQDSKIQKKDKKKDLLRGLPVSCGFAEGHASYLGKSIGFDEIDPEETDEVESEVRRLENAFGRSQEEIAQLSSSVQDLSDGDEAILEVHHMALQDKAFRNKTIAYIRGGYGAEYALKKAVFDYLELFSKMDDPYLRERGSDIEHVGKRVLRNLLGLGGSSAKKFNKATIIIASDISPTDIVALRQENLKAIVLSKGGETSHAAILARSFEIPMVIGVKEVVESVREDDFLIVDGTSGVVFPKPFKEIIDEYQRLRDEKAQHDHRLSAIRDLPATTIDGHEIMLGANIGLLSDLELVEKYGAGHIGLYRTEFPFLAREQFPSEDEQFTLYKKMVEGAQGKEVTIRTLDVGGDKFLSYLDYPKEQNPYLGWRSIRVSLELDDIFRHQIRAILRASAFGNVKLLFPMITSVEEVRKIICLLDEEKHFLREEGIPFDRKIRTGILIEVPAAVKILDKLLRYVDCVSIGTNDLIQYTLAVDRNNPRVASLYNPLHPAVIATILEVVSICKTNNRSVSICGEAASNPKCAYLFLGMETDQLSMNAASVPIIKDLVRRVRLTDAKNALDKVLRMEDAEEIAAFLEELVVT